MNITAYFQQNKKTALLLFAIYIAIVSPLIGMFLDTEGIESSDKMFWAILFMLTAITVPLMLLVEPSEAETHLECSSKGCCDECKKCR